MRIRAPLSLSLLLAIPSLSLVAHAEDRHEQQRHEEHAEVRQEQHHEAQRLPPRAPPPAWRGHPPGVHPAGPAYHPTYHPHPVRVLAPRTMRYGEHPYQRWGHPEFVRPVYYWNWSAIRSVTCVAEDSYGDQYPVTETTGGGFGLDHMTQVEDDTLDRCYDESGGDQSCHLATCSHY
jgi:hypothetical protein